MAQVRGLDAAEGTVAVMVGNEILQCLLPGDEGGLQDIVQQIYFCADGSCLGIGQLAVHIHKDLTGPVQILHHDIQVVGQDGEAAHDDQARHRDAHGGERHEAVEENATEAFL